MASELEPCPFCSKTMMLRSALWPSEGDADAIIHADPTDCPMLGFSDGSADGSIIEKWNCSLSNEDDFPSDGSCVRCGSVPRNANGLCNTCLDEDAERLENTRTTPVAPVSPDATGVAQTFDQIVSYVLRYGGNCRDCADVDGICPNTDMPCGFELKTAVIKHTLKALEYGLSHGFIENPFSLPAPDATGKCGELVTVAWFQPSQRCCDNGWMEAMAWQEGEFSAPVVLRSQAVELLAAERNRADANFDKVIEQAKRAEKAEADNAAKEARIKELDKTVIGLLSAINRVIDPAPGLRSMPLPEWAKGILSAAYVAWKDKPTFHIDKEPTDALEAKLAAAEKALKTARPYVEDYDTRRHNTGVDETLTQIDAALGGKPS